LGSNAGLEPICKPNSVCSANAEEAAIYLDSASPRNSRDLPECRSRGAGYCAGRAARL